MLGFDTRIVHCTIPGKKPQKKDSRTFKIELR
jgi:hypothetical protein